VQRHLGHPRDLATSAIGVTLTSSYSVCLSLATTSPGRRHFLFERFIGDSSRPLGP
jgi:hypothetical protein